MLARRIAGAVLVLLSLGAIVLSLGAPGLGWALSGLTLIAASMCSPLIGRNWLIACLVLALALLFTFGPLGRYSPSADFGWPMLAFTFAPLAIALAALLVSLRRPSR